MDQPLSLESEPMSQSLNEQKTPPNSQTKTTAIDSERVSLQELNDRLQTYIEVMRGRADPSLNGELTSNNLPFLSIQIDLIKSKYEEVISQKDEMNGNLIHEVSDLRKSCEELVISKQNMGDEVIRLENSIAELTKKLKTLEYEVKSKDNLIYEQRNKMEGLKQNVSILNNELLDIKNDLLSKKDEIYSYSEKNNSLTVTIQFLKDKIRFLEDLHKDELNAAYQTIDELRDASMQEECLNSQNINDLRQELQEELNNAKMNVIAAYKSSLAEREGDLQILRHECKELNERNAKLQYDLSSTQQALETEKEKADQLRIYLRNLQKDNDITMRNLRDKNHHLEKRLDETNDKLDNLMKEYEKLVTDHLNLDTELTVYQTLLDSEEKRLGISMEERKNKLFEYKLTSEPGSRLEITQIDNQTAHSITILNTSNKNFTLMGYKLRVSSEESIIDYKVPKVTIPSMETCILASSSYVRKPDELVTVLEQLETFAPLGDEIKFSLLNKKDELVLNGKITRCPVQVSYLSTPSATRSRKRKSIKSNLQNNTNTPLKRPAKGVKVPNDTKNKEISTTTNGNNGCNVM